MFDLNFIQYVFCTLHHCCPVVFKSLNPSLTLCPAAVLNWTFKVVQNSANELPIGWSAKDIGVTWKKGSTRVESGHYKMQALGSDVWLLADNFHFASRSLNGDGEVIARISRLDKSHKWAKAGLMIRASSWTGSKNVFLAMTPDQGVHLQYRSTSSWETHSGDLKPASMGSWLKLKRSGDAFSAYTSNDGLTWNLVGSVTVSMDQEVDVGLAVTSHKWFKTTYADFDSVWVEDY